LGGGWENGHIIGRWQIVAAGAALQGKRIDSKAQPTRWRAIWEHMSQVSVAHVAGGLDTAAALAITVVGHHCVGSRPRE